MANAQIPLTTIMQFVNLETGELTNEGRTVINALINRTGGALGGTILFAGSEVYGPPVGALYRGSYQTTPLLPVGVVYSQAEMGAIKGQVQTLGQLIGALITDLQAVGAIQS